MPLGQLKSVDDWYKFEKLTGVLFKVAFGLDENEFVFTRAVKDGGKDAIVSKLLSAHGLNSIEVKAWIEAKYRSKDNVDLSDIGGNVIIASNSSIRSVYFVTNQFYKPQAIEQLMIFQVRTGLQIELVDGNQYRNLLQKHYDSLEKEDFEDNKITLRELLKFSKILLSSLPDSPSPIEYKVSLTIERGKISQTKEFAKLCSNETKLERRSVDLSSILGSEETLALSKAKLRPIVSDEEIHLNPNYRLIGEGRKQLYSQATEHLRQGKTVIVKGASGQGKTFFSNHVARAFYQTDSYVLFVDIGNQDILSITKSIILDIIGIDYFKYLEDRTAVVEYLSSYYAISQFAANKVIDLIQMDNVSGEISNELCLQLLLRLLENNAGRKDLLIVVDNLHMATRDLLTFAKNLFGFLNKMGIPVLVLTREQTDDWKSDNDWLIGLDAMIESNHFVPMTMLKLQDSDIRDYIRMLVPGASDVLVKLIEENTLPSPFYIKLYVDFLKSEHVIKSKDGRYWLLDDKHLAIHLDSSLFSNKQIEYLIASNLKRLFKDDGIKRTAQLVFLFNNMLPEEVYKQLIRGAELEKLVNSNLFHASIIGNSFVIAFSHDLYFNNFKGGLVNPEEELNLQSLRILAEVSDGLLGDVVIGEDVLGTLFDHVGDSTSAYRHYLKFARSQRPFDGFRSLLFFEKALDSFLMPTGEGIGNPSYNQELTDIVFQLLPLYSRYNLLSGRKSDSLFNLLRRLDDRQQLSPPQQARLLFFKGVRETKDENFWVAKEAFSKALNLVKNYKEITPDIAENIITSYGINLKHIGKKDESLTFFEAAYKERKSKRINHEKYSNEAAYYLTSNPDRSLKCYEYIRDTLNKKDNLHLMIDFGMVHFYRKQYGLAKNQLESSLQLAREQSNLAEEARAENILGVLLWENQKSRLAEEYLDLAAANCELANNHRWLWRIRTNQAQVAWINENEEKAYNVGWAVISHLTKTKAAIIQELKQTQPNSRRFASLKAILYVYYKMGRKKDVTTLNELLEIAEVTNFWKQLNKYKGVLFDQQDSNRYGDNYYILG